jgi:hypothetical protein
MLKTVARALRDLALTGAAVAGLFATSATAVELSGAGGAAAPNGWPGLPSRGFISGRPAHATDIQNGDAVFVAAVHGAVIGKPLPIESLNTPFCETPGNASSSFRQKTRMELKIFGVRGIDGKSAVVTDGDLELLGTQMPN